MSPRKPKAKAPVEAVEETPSQDPSAPTENTPVDPVQPTEEVVQPTEEVVQPTEEVVEEDAVAEPGEEEPEPDEPEVTVSDAARVSLSNLSTKLIKAIESVSDEEVKDADTAEQIRLGAARILEEAVGSLDANRVAVQELEAVLGEATKEAQKLGEAHRQLTIKSDSYRSERDAFVALNNLNEDEFQALIAASRSGKAEKEKAE